MKSETLLKVIKLVVQEELNKTLPGLISEAVSAQLKGILTEAVNNTTQTGRANEVVSKPTQRNSSAMQSPKKEDQRTNRKMSDAEKAEYMKRIKMQKKKEAPVQPKKKLSKNELLNSVLNETTPFSGEQYGGNSMYFNSKDVHGIAAKSKKQINDSNSGNQETAGLGVNTGIPKVDNALNRDYSALMAAIDKKKGKG